MKELRDILKCNSKRAGGTKKEIEVTEKINYRLLSITKVHKNRLEPIVIDNNRYKNHRFLSENDPYYSKSTLFYRFLSIDIGNRYSSMIDIDYYQLLSIIGLSIIYVWSRTKMVATWIYKITIARATMSVISPFVA